MNEDFKTNRNSSGICELCKRKMTNDTTKLDDYKYTFSVDTDDYRCDKCQAHEIAYNCSRMINSDMSKYREIAQADRIFDKRAFLESKLTLLKKYWVAYYSEMVDKQEYSYLYDVLKQRVDELTKDSTEIVEKVEKTKYGKGVRL